jgi:hypothetical protein
MRRMNLKHGIGNGIAHGSVGRYAMNGNLVIGMLNKDIILIFAVMKECTHMLKALT